MQKFLNNSGRLYLVDDQSLHVYSTRYENDHIKPSRLMFHTTPQQVTALIASGSLNPYYPVTSK